MASIRISDLTVELPVYGVDSRSLKKEVARAVGGRFGADRAGHTVVRALDGLNLELRPGDRLGLIGGNGAGKTTLLRVLAGAYPPTQGRVEITGKVNALLDVGIGLDPAATGYENIYMRGLLNGLTRAEVDARIDEIASFSELGDFLRFPLKTYSAGMQARLAFAVATSMEADILLMDEWLAVGDADFRAAAHDRLAALVDRASILVLASHDSTIIESLCNRTIRLAQGRVVETQDLRAAPQVDEATAEPVLEVSTGAENASAAEP